METPQLLRRRPSRYTWWLIVLSLVGLTLRLVYLLAHQDVDVVGDGEGYHLSATLATQGEWFELPFPGGGPDAHHPPLWTLILSLVSVAGRTSLLDHQIVAVLIGTSAIALVGLAGRRIAGERTGLIAAGLAAVYPGWWQYERELLSEVLLVPLVALVLLLAYGYRDRPSLARAVALGAACAVLSSARSEQALLFVLLVVPVVLAARGISWRRRLTWLAASAASAAVILAPWTIFNAGRFHEPVVLSTSLGVTMAAGACDATFSGDLLGHFDSPSCVYPHIGTFGSRDRSEVDLRYRSVALDYTRGHLDRLPVVLLAREGRTFGLYRPFQEVRLASEFGQSPLWVGYAWTLLYWMLLPLAAWGAVLLRRRRVWLYPLLVEFIVVAIGAAITFGLVRYRVAAEVPLVILSAVALDHAWKWWRGRSSAPAQDLGSTRETVSQPAG